MFFLGDKQFFLYLSNKMPLIKNTPKSILIAWSTIIAVGFGTFVFAKDMVDNERRAEDIRKIKQMRKIAAFQKEERNKEQEK